MDTLRIFEPCDDWELMEGEDPWTGELVQLCVPKVEAEKLHQLKPLTKLSFSGKQERSERKGKK